MSRTGPYALKRIPKTLQAKPSTLRPKENSTISARIIASSPARGRRARRRVTSNWPGINVNTMKHALFNVFAAGLVTLLAAAAALPQRSFSTMYDSNREVKLQGVVTRIDWVNPNAFLFID